MKKTDEPKVGQKSNDMVKILTSPNANINQCEDSANGVLARIFRKIILNYHGPRPNGTSGKLTQTEFQIMKDKYIEEEEGLGDNIKNQVDRGTISSSIVKEFSRPAITWAVFMKALRLLQVYRANLTLTLELKTGRTLVIDTPIVFKLFSPEEIQDMYKTGQLVKSIKEQSTGQLQARKKQLIEELGLIEEELLNRKDEGLPKSRKRTYKN